MNDETRCSVVRDLLPGYIDNLTSEQTNAFVKAHLAECAECRAVHRAMTGRLNADEIRTQRMLKNMKRRKRLRAARAWGAVALALLIAAACALPLPRRVQRTYQAMEWRCGDETYAVPRNVSIDGYYMDYLFRPDQFSGSILVEGYPITTQTMSRCEFIGGMALMSYYSQVPAVVFGYEEAGTLHHLGQLMMEPDGRAFAILVFEKNSWSGENGVVITGPADDLAAAMDLTRTLARKYAPGMMGITHYDHS